MPLLTRPAMPAALRELDDELDKIFKETRSKNFSIKRTGRLDTHDEPMPLTEPDDMVIFTSPCHVYEPIKVPEAKQSGPFHCLICGNAFGV